MIVNVLNFEYCTLIDGTEFIRMNFQEYNGESQYCIRIYKYFQETGNENKSYAGVFNFDENSLTTIDVLDDQFLMFESIKYRIRSYLLELEKDAFWSKSEEYNYNDSYTEEYDLPYDPYSLEAYDPFDPPTCGACQESPCMCSDPW